MSPIQTIVLLGAGHVATHLALAFRQAGFSIYQVYNRTREKGEHLAGLVGAQYVSSLDEVDPAQDLYILAVTDQAIPLCASGLHVDPGMVVHTSGSVGLDVLSGTSSRTGVFYPLQTFRDHTELDFSQVPVCLEGNTPAVLQQLSLLATLMGNAVYPITSGQRKILHLTAVLTGNFTNFLYAKAEEILTRHGISFDLLKPLIRQTAENAETDDIFSRQTGPAIREDHPVVAEHVRMLSEMDPAFADIYHLLSKSIMHQKTGMSNYKAKLRKITTFIFDYDGVLTEGTIIMNEHGEALRISNIKDGYALQLAVKYGYRVAIISGARSKSMEHRLKALKITDVFLGIGNKLETFHSYLHNQAISPEEVLFMGDDIPDYQIMQEAGMPTCPSDAVEEIKRLAAYISHIPGGKGCVRDVIEQVMKVQGKWMNDDAFYW